MVVTHFHLRLRSFLLDGADSISFSNAALFRNQIKQIYSNSTFRPLPSVVLSTTSF
jgi:hypothetical protein